ncbi:tyrosine-protein phosphatase [Blastococcus goldschmidtiae]|uniref:Tyrosine-protein phosphatase n=1 Tax=Blastococcus goldschmidtiae TaxID=3075546 RepID=A0ABU2K4V0_9ACTN|nr:tyrosine-protein phosphatase [Blastococcus sp. DSM 46792]MDT0275220.1 tyrosine-protein phosphatase [Blastococcus sp. DSM 46792]
MAAAGPPRARTRGLLAGFANSADLGGLELPDGRRVPSGRIIRADTPAHVTEADVAAARAVGFEAVLDLRSHDEVRDCPHPLAQLAGYRSLPLIDPAAEARADISRYRTLGEIYSSSLQRNATHIAAIFAALAESPQGPGPVLVCCRAGRDRTGMVIALLLDLAGADREVIAADYALVPELPGPGAPASPGEGHSGGDAVLRMLDHVSAAYGSTSGYLRRLGLGNGTIDALRRRVEP